MILSYKTEVKRNTIAVMRKIVLGVCVLVGALSLFACTNTNDCLCSYADGTTTSYYDYDGDCSEMVFDELDKKAAPGTSASFIGCTDN